LGLTGEIEVRGPGVFSGYWHEHEHEHEHEPEPEPAGLFRDGFFRTGDLGRFDRDGYLELVGRSRDVVITGGLNVYPKEVELVLDAIDGVAESAVIGMPDPDFGEAVVAFVVPQPGHRPGADDLRQVVRSLLAGYKVPKRIEFVDALPRNAMGKVAKAELRDRAHPSGPRAVG
jgi:malonyl-CoA/methylmalonyl-CoA synthetase